MRVLIALLHGCCLAWGTAGAHELATRPAEPSVFRVLTTTWRGAELSGSAVAIAPTKLVTNCHVVRDARWIEVARGAKRWSAEIHAGDAHRDLCILSAAGLHAPSVVQGRASTLKRGEPVYAVGYGGGAKQVIGAGEVEALYRYGGAKVIQTSAPFEQGASGGALINLAGELVGILTFKAPTGGAFHFAMPVEWISAVETSSAAHEQPLKADVAFYQVDPLRRPHFLRAVWYQAAQKWSEAHEICQHWVSSEPENDEALTLMDTLKRPPSR